MPQILMRREHIDYVMIGPLERASMSVNETFFSNYVKIAERGPYHFYKVSSEEPRSCRPSGRETRGPSERSAARQCGTLGA
jgi:hypothetical protein